MLVPVRAVSLVGSRQVKMFNTSERAGWDRAGPFLASPARPNTRGQKMFRESGGVAGRVAFLTARRDPKERAGPGVVVTCPTPAPHSTCG